MNFLYFVVVRLFQMNVSAYKIKLTVKLSLSGITMNFSIKSTVVQNYLSSNPYRKSSFIPAGKINRGKR